jgi:hypothetical protein
VSFVTASPSHACRNVDTSAQARRKSHHKVRKKKHPSKGPNTLTRVGREGVAPTDDLCGRALVAEPAAEPATTASAAEPATAAASASTSAEPAAAAAPSRWPHGARGASGLEGSWVSGVRRRVLAERKGREGGGGRLGRRGTVY